MRHDTHPGIEILTVDTPDLGDRSYVVGDGTVAAVIDPQRDIDRVLDVVEGRGWRIDLVVETHIHNDYVSGGLELARRTGARYAVAADDHVEFDRLPVHAGDVLRVGGFSLEVVASPGHTPHHVSYVLRGDGDNREFAAFTGGSVLYGAVGRTDLIAPEATEDLARDQFRSAHALPEVVPDSATLYPTHGFGSFCSSNRGVEVAVSTLGDERHRNPVFTASDEDAFVRDLIAGYTVYPSYYAHMGPMNRRGPAPVDLEVPPSISEEEIAERIARGGWVVDLRDRVSYALGHRPGTVNFELCEHLATYVAWVLPFDAELTLVGVSESDIADARRSLARVGFDSVTGKGLGPAAFGTGEPATYEVADFAALADAWVQEEIVVLDVRRDDEWIGGHIPGAVHVHLPDLLEHVDEIPEREVWVHCASGFRAGIGASLLARAGRDVVLVDDEWDGAAARGIEVVTPRRTAA